MGKVNILVKRSYICVLSLIAITALLLLGIALFTHALLFNHDKEDHLFTGLHFFYGFSVVNLTFAIIGGFGVWKEKKWALILFAVGMILGSLFCITKEIYIVTTLPEVERFMKKEYLTLLPLSNSSENQLDVENMQRYFHCCGLMSSDDWEKIPETCKCEEDSTEPCVDVSRNTSGLQDLSITQPIRIYATPCLPILIEKGLYVIHVVLGILLGLILLWILAIGLCIAILCQINKKVETPKVVYSPEAKAGNYTNLSEDLEDT